ncbi:cytochrome P450 2A5-like [Bombina bombina]|uniref:cytochrome P450 2A5-like n=1 Tax=Bombina bombina TaxID=8345 RepID=UPI00235ABDDF|nr:cytochrome P450 2A5-like [Bombina bombina]
MIISSLLAMDPAGSITLTLIFCVSCIFLLILLTTQGRVNGLPPGPKPLPLLGNILQIERGKMVQSLVKMREKYGNVFTLYFGKRRVIILTGYQTVKEALVDQAEEFSGRGECPSFDACYKNNGLIFTNNMERWRQLRRFTVVTFKDFGMGKKIAEDWIKDEAQHIVSEFRKTKGKFFSPNHLLSLASLNVSCFILFGNRFEYDHKELHTVIEMVHGSFEVISSAWGQIYEIFPGFMRFIPGKHHKIFKCLNSLLAFSEERVEICRQKLDPSSPQSYIDSFLIKIETEKDNPNTAFTLPNLICNVAQLLFSAADTTSETLNYGILLLLKYPEIQAKVKQEIDQVIGENRSPTFQDKSKMPYTEAVIHEIQRFINLIPFGAPRATTRDVVFKGYHIPKGTTVYAMLGTVLNDPQCWIDPHHFNPQNFLDDLGNFKKNDGFMPFSAGKRNCLGEGLARMMLFLFLTTILQNFTLKSPLPSDDLDISPEVSGMGNFPKFYQTYI